MHKLSAQLLLVWPNLVAQLLRASNGRAENVPGQETDPVHYRISRMNLWFARHRYFSYAEFE